MLFAVIVMFELVAVLAISHLVFCGSKKNKEAKQDDGEARKSAGGTVSTQSAPPAAPASAAAPAGAPAAAPKPIPVPTDGDNNYEDIQVGENPPPPPPA
ncbi:hypothetical protein TELCIR_06877 [Teladorsagia circumcincta]|uniref:Uncharacterized protein n=1 Tax=Teladorsagia circumcincta TaxID=45464 RepID=A0A2G9T9U4_TELCI|nr:hypothetical protein TELCIR_23901 [Teladorsagia circumcincta]PIO71231.1 hypothetical protein TELCIR_06877 [Teladorsagia circumcincta]